MKKVYRIITNLTREKNNEVMSNLDDYDQDLLMTLETDTAFDVVGDNGLITTYMVCNELNIEKVKSCLFKYKVEFNTEDLSDIFIDESIENREEFLSGLTQENIVDKINSIEA
jgi:hypothetical protein